MSTNTLDVKALLAAGAHFGHQTQKWNPKMRPYVFGERNGIYIVDLSKTVPLAAKAYKFLKETAMEGRPVLFVGTKRQAAETVQQAAKDCGAFYVTHRWLGGMLTNFKTITLSVDKLRKVEKMKETGDFNLLTKKERSKINKEVAKLERNLGGIKEMRKLPGALFIVDPDAERIAVKEANVLGIPVVAVTDTNCDPTGIDFVVPGNDDAIKAVSLFTGYFANAVSEGSAAAGQRSGVDRKGEQKDVALESEIISKFEQDIDLQLSEDDDSDQVGPETEKSI